MLRQPLSGTPSRKAAQHPPTRDRAKGDGRGDMETPRVTRATQEDPLRRNHRQRIKAILTAARPAG